MDDDGFDKDPDGPPAPRANTGFARASGRIERWWDRERTKVLVLLFGFLFLLVFLAPRIFLSIRSGQAAVQWKRFGQGTVTNFVLGEGFHVLAPWDTTTIYDVRIQQKEHRFMAIATNGLAIGVDVSIRYRPSLPLLGLLHKEVGPDYLDKIIVPEVQALIRDRLGQFTPEEIYTTKRSLIQDSLSSAVAQVGEEYLLVDDLLIKGITLPSGLQEAIESKLVQEQRQLEMRFRIGKEEAEVERKIIEGLGISAYNQIISGSITDPLLTYRGIDSTLELAKSPNTKIVMVGTKNGLPLILDGRGDNTGLTITNGSMASSHTSYANQPTLIVPQQSTTNAIGSFYERLMPRLIDATAQMVRGATNILISPLQSLRPRHD